MSTLLTRDAAHAAFPTDCSGDWHVLHTKSRQEKALSDELQARDISVYLPLSREVRFHGKRKVTVETPLFPGYVFLRGSLDDAYDADRTGRLANILRVSDQDRFGRELESIHVALSSGAGLRTHPYLRRSTRVCVKSGPFRGLTGLIEAEACQNRLVLQLTTLGQAVSVEIEASLLEPAD